jgi:hypothetical protein
LKNFTIRKAVFYYRFEHDLKIAGLTGLIVKSKNRFIVFKSSRVCTLFCTPSSASFKGIMAGKKACPPYNNRFLAKPKAVFYCL